ncbi:hypothetical protein Godav_005833 [Gossypium davidsonii]|uniref:Uncharacterized protein n=1 Tax=Gossypium davidsonii TaxID=34287 RepID=A0A7J8S3B0_GOSDV|nr:hypothetical protein [Gossypium davidsonii]
MLYFMGKGDITQLVELRSCNWVVAIMSWVSNCIGGNDSILFSMDRTSTVIGVSDSSRFPHLEFLGKDQQKKGKPMDQPHRLHPVRTTRSPKDVINIQGSWIDHRTLFNKWNTLAVRSQVGHKMKVVSCVRGGELLSIVGLYGRISRGPERQWFTLWQMSAVRVRLSSTRELSRNKAI